jgi:hypothetical protein
MKLCIHCKYVIPSLSGKIDDNARCGQDRTISLVTGSSRGRDTLPFAELERRNTGRCKPEAENWEAADHVMTPEEEELMLKEAKYV